MEGYQNRVLRVNLKDNSAKSEPLNMPWAEKYIGGKGLGIKYLYEELSPSTEALSPANKLILMTGPLTGTIIPCTGKLSIVSRSPATGTILDCSIGGHVAAELKYAGYDALIVEQKAKRPSYLYIEDDLVELKDASSLWTTGAHEAEKKLIDSYGPDVKILVIGPAGEKMLPMACINTEFYRQAGRGGIGAVMGSKNLKAIVIRGTKGLKVGNMDKMMAIIPSLMREDTLSDHNYWAYTDGTPMTLELSQTSGVLPTNNFQDGTFQGYEKINAEAVASVRKGKKACFSCCLACGNYTSAGNVSIVGPEYETLALCGSNCGIDNLEAIIAFNRACDDMGLDTISVGNVTALAMEMTEKGVHDFGLRFGQVDSYLAVPESIGRQKGIGVDLALGARKLAAKYGGKHYAMEIKGLELPGYEPRGSWGMGLAYATADRGACHMRAWPVGDEAFGDLEPCSSLDKGRLVRDLQHYNAAKYSAIFCDFWALEFDTMADLLSLACDKHFSVEDLVLAGERVVNIARLFNQREGFTAEDDTLPGRVFQDPLKSGVTAGKVFPESEFIIMLREYYDLRGWNQDGSVSREKIEELDL